jgi:hypothetical protein
VVGIIERLPDNQRLDITQTYESQKKIVNNYIVPIVQKAINKKAFPVSDGIIKHIIKGVEQPGTIGNKDESMRIRVEPM